MDSNTKQDILQEQFLKGVYQPASMIDELKNEDPQLIKVLTEHTTMLDLIKQELRGEQLYQYENGERHYIQTDKPRFTLLDEYNKPVMKFNSRTKKQEYVPNEEAISEMLAVLKAAGLNSITPMTNLDDNNIRADLLEIQSKVAVVLCNKRKKWGMDKALYPLICSEINTLIQDARYKAKDAIVLKAVRTMSSVIETRSEGQPKKKLMEGVASPFK